MKRSCSGFNMDKDRYFIEDTPGPDMTKVDIKIESSFDEHWVNVEVDVALLSFQAAAPLRKPRSSEAVRQLCSEGKGHVHNLLII